MGIALKRSAISPNIKERMDHSCAVVDAQGNVVAQAEHIPVHLGSFRIGIRNTLKWLEEHNQTLEEGDMLILNDPYISGTHLNDVMIMAPVYQSNDLLAYVVNKAHNVDVGGPVFGSMNPNAKTIFEEGFVIPPTKIQRGNEINREMVALITENFKDRETAIGDLNAQMAANRTGISKIKDLFQRYGSQDVTKGWDKAIEHAEQLAKTEFGEWRKGEFEAFDFLEKDHERIRISVILRVEQDKITADFAGTSEQVEYPINAVFGVSYSATAYAVRSFMKIDLPTNEGFYRLVEVSAPEGSLLNPKKPAAVSAGNTETAQRIADVVLSALGKCMPEKAVANSSGTMMSTLVGGKRKDGRLWAYIETIGGGNGARPTGPGVSGVQSNMTNTMNTPIEIAEREYPLFFTAYKLRENSGGSGKFKGGEGIIRSFKVLSPTMVSIIGDRFLISPKGVFGGAPGKHATVRIIRKGRIREMPSKFSEMLEPQDEVIIMTSGGGGYGKRNSSNQQRASKHG